MSAAPIEVGAPPSTAAAFEQASQLFVATVAEVPDQAWDAPTPCGDWTVRDVTGHVVGTLIEVAAIVRDEPFSREWSRAADAAGDDPLESLRTAADDARAAVGSGDLEAETEAMHGRRTVGEALAFPIADLAVHAWDVSRAVGSPLVLPDALLAHVVHTCAQVPEEVLRGPNLFGPARPAGDDADDTTRLMAWLGRDVT